MQDCAHLPQKIKNYKMDKSFNPEATKNFNSGFHDDDADLFEIRKDILRESLSDIYDKVSDFETIAMINNVEYINDSSSLTIHSSGSSLLHCFKPVTWIMTKLDEEVDYTEISEIVEEKVKNIICIDKNVNAVFYAFRSEKAQLVLNAETLEEAIQIAAVISKSGEIVLFSPASGNTNKGDGKTFNEAIRELKKKLTSPS